MCVLNDHVCKLPTQVSFHVGEAAHIVTDGRCRLNSMGRSQHIAEARQKMFLAGYGWVIEAVVSRIKSYEIP